MNGQDGLSSSFVESVAGFTAGIVSTLCLHPLDLIKTRLQVDRSSTSRVGGSLRVVRSIYQNEGGVAAFYRGLTPNIIGNSTSWALYFLCYGNIKTATRTWRSSREEDLTSSDYFLASGAAVLGRPERMRLSLLVPHRYIIQRVFQVSIVASFQLFWGKHGALQFMAYEKLKLHRIKMSSATMFNDGNAESAQVRWRGLGNLDLFIISSLSKIFAGFVTYPYQVLRSRLQTYNAHLIYRGVQDAALQIWAREGAAGFYKGLGPNILRVLPSTWVTFLVYENTRAYLPELLSRA
ncbi:folate carrier protein [Aspergillus arachidicola]|uniref:Folate carrier protein n=1 Tax=Aspergillus arachidicola TaxID=656916 RepID=A0A2G7FL56_9EURO|nr:folate carrier protein [Aspergillus arachidicola]